MVGISIVAMFIGMTLFGDIIAPYDPEQFFTGPWYGRPNAIPELPLFLLTSGIVLAVLATAVWWILDKNKRPEISRYYVSILSGGLIVFIAVIFGTRSVQVENVTTLYYSIAIGLIASVIIIRGLITAKQEINLQRLKLHLPRLFVALLGVVGIGLIVDGILIAPWVAPLDFPGFHLMGTDQLGRDVYSQLIIAVRITLLIGIVSTAMSVIIGTLIGLIAGYFGGIVDSFLMRFTDIFFVIPSLLLMIVMAAVLGASIITLIIVIGLFSWPSTARIVRGQVLSIKERTYIERVRAVGGSNTYISWGTMLFLAFSAGSMSNNLWWLVFPPGIMVILLLLGVSLVGYAMDEIVNPRLRRR
jgi:peptide/nickel transport system permease protein